MDKTGLIWKFKVNRELAQGEKSGRLLVGEASVPNPSSQLTAIRMNSTYLECVDKFYFGKGDITATGIFVFVGLTIFLSLGIREIFAYPTVPEYEQGEALFVIIAIPVTVIPAMFFFWFTGLGKELFRYTHCPVRFNRKTRMVHVFRLNGTVMSEAWDKLYFVIGVGEEFETREVRFHRMSEDGKTVLETHALPSIACWDRPRSQWEFVRRYMEEGPAAVLPHIDHVLDAHIGQPGKRESFGHGYWIFSVNCSPLIFYVFFPMNIAYVIGRWIAMRTCKHPVWPAEIEAVCQVEPDDPYQVDANHLPEGVKP